MNILFLTHRLPYAPNRGDRIRAYYLLREMSRFARRVAVLARARRRGGRERRQFRSRRRQ